MFKLLKKVVVVTILMEVPIKGLCVPIWAFVVL